MIGSWLSGPNSVLPEREGYPGDSFGLPESGPGSLAGNGRRFGALTVDWLLAMGLGALIRFDQPSPSVTMAIWMAIGIVAVALVGRTPGQYLFGLEVCGIERPGVGFGRAIIRSVLLAFVIPALFTNRDGRGLQDRASGTGVLRARSS